MNLRSQVTERVGVEDGRAVIVVQHGGGDDRDQVPLRHLPEGLKSRRLVRENQEIDAQQRARARGRPAKSSLRTSNSWAAAESSG